MKKYDFSRWSREDWEMYQYIYENQLFDPRVQQFFEEQKRMEDRWAKRYEKYLTLFCDLSAEIDVYSCHPAFELLVVSKQTMQIVFDAIKELPKAQGQRFYLQYVVRFSQSEIARMENVSIKAVQGSVASARKKLKEKLKYFRK
jgi:DNA-directed RNA polymerase specialized sigma24 family protein